MSKYEYTETERQINNVLKYNSEELKKIKIDSSENLDNCISSSEKLLQSLGYDLGTIQNSNQQKNSAEKKVMVLPTWEKLCAEAEKTVGTDNDLELLFTEEELQNNQIAIKMLNQEFNMLHNLDKFDIGISAIAGILGGAVDILMVGIPQKTSNGISAGTLSNYIRKHFDEKFPADEMGKLANSKVSKVPYDAQDNRNTTVNVDGLSSYYHRLLALGHDPLLGFIIGVSDILTGRMTTIDKSGKIVSQVMDNYANRKESDVFAAIAKQIIHLKSDITTSMGLPVPLMGLFNLLQFGSIGEAEQTIAEIVQGMYFEGYDFIHFCSMTVPTMIVEVIVRLSYSIKRIKEGNSIKDSIPFSLNREKHPKLATMLFIGHSGSVAINAGKVYFTKNPLAINYAQWIAFAKYSYQQLKWSIINKPNLRNAYVLGQINEELNSVYLELDETWDSFTKEYIVIMD